MILPQQLSKLKPMAQWVNYARIWNPKKHDGTGGYDKPPINPHTLRDAKTTDPATWATFDQAAANIGKTATHWDPKARKEVTAEVEGAGLVLAGGFCGVDFDDVIDDNGNIPEFVAEILDRLNTYTEISPSGRGLHCLLYCPDLLEAGENFGGQFFFNRQGAIVPNDRAECEVEIYFYTNGGRYLTVTGNIYRDRGANAKKGRFLRALYDECRDKTQKLRAAIYAAKMQSVGSQSSQYTTHGSATTDDDRKMIESAFPVALKTAIPGHMDFKEWAAFMTVLSVFDKGLQTAQDWSAGDYCGIPNPKNDPAYNAWRWPKFKFPNGNDRAAGIVINYARRGGWKPADAFDDEARRKYGRSLYTEEQRKEYGRQQHQKRMDEIFENHAADFETWKARKAADPKAKVPFMLRDMAGFEDWKRRKRGKAAADPERKTIMLRNKQADFEKWKAERGTK